MNTPDKSFRSLVAVIAFGLGALSPGSDAYALGLTGFGARAGGHWGLGQMSNSSGDVASRTMNTFSLEALPGYNLAGFLIGPFVEFRLVGQNTNPSTVGGTNLRGHGFQFGLGTSYDFGPLSFLAALEFFGSHALSNNDLSGNPVTYQKPFGFVLEGGYKFLPSVTADLRFSWTRYSQAQTGTLTTDISTNRLSQWDLSLGASFHL